MTYEDLFIRYGTRQECASHEIHIYAHDPSVVTSTSEISRLDEWAAQSIAGLESYISAMREYRQHLAARYGELVTMPYTLRIDANREKRDCVRYYICITKVFEDGTEDHGTYENFHGKDRAKFYARLRELEKQYPNASHKYTLEKARWER